MNKTDDMKSAWTDDFKLDAMRAMGWNVDADIPMANDENLAILQSMDELRALKFDLQQKLKQLDERDKAIERHRRNIDATVQQNITFYNTVKNDVLKEAHKMQLVILERNKLKEDLRKNKKEMEEYTELSERMQRTIAQNKHEIDDMTSRIKSSKTALLEWTEAMEDGNKGYELIEKYYLDDQQKARELNTRRQQLQAEIDKKRKVIVQLYDEQNTLEKNLERTACLYRTAHLERRQMVETWKQAVNQMTQRETDIQQGEEECLALEERAETRAADYREYDKQLDRIIENNREVEATIEELNMETSGMKAQLQQLIDAGRLKEREIEGLRKELENLSNSVHLQRLENRKLIGQRDAKLAEIEKSTEMVQQITERMQAMENKTMNAAQRLQILEDMNDSEDKLLRDLTKEQDRVNDLLFRTQRQIDELKDEEKTLLVNTDALRSTLNAMRRSSRGLEKELRRQTEIHYNMAFKYLEAERRLATMRGSQVDPEAEERNQQTLADLEQYYAKLQRRLVSTEAQNKKLNYSMNALVGVYNNDAKELDLVKFKIKEAQVYCEGTVKRVRQNRFENSELIVELSLVKMRCRDMELGIEGCEKGTYDLAQHRLQFQRAVKDRFVELRSQEDVLNLKRKHLSEELSTLRADLGERKKHIEAVRARFELTSRLLGTNDDGTVVTATQLKVESAQERQLLADQGDALNKKVLKAEAEVVALENTLRQFDRSNDNYRQTFKKADESSKAQEKAEEELKELQATFCNDLNKLKFLRCKVQRYDAQQEQQKAEQDELLKKVEAAKQKRAENSELLEKLRKELEEQHTKMDRAAREIRQALKEIKQRPISDDFLEMFERDLDLQELENRNTKALNLLADMAASDEDGPEIIHYMLRKGLKLPQHLKRTRSCVSWKSASSSSMDASYISSLKGFSARSSASDMSSAKDDSSTHLSVVSLNFPDKI
ncbi:coiled-coil domain-containing protein 39 [Scaptodrosophila lebanonensis]|uniref:Coiled-coil domain-containing protein 39 n=1 Tax=Drosophila lebanonensis TaxID=7225 RepID=A0A6J2TC21_DROLE|nr:coiled-coil domain-containing protein 39 [Scaptodrosophila lebanonensis]